VDADQVSLRRLITPLVLCLVAFGLRLGPLWANRFHSDEALYATWALEIASGRDVLLSSVAPDKPPLLFYTMAAAFAALGRAEVAARLAGLMAGVICVALAWVARPDWPGRPIRSDAAAAAMALSPFAISFSPTAFLDPLMAMLALTSLVAALRRQPGWAGAFLGLATATKVQALIFLPLIAACGALAYGRRRRSWAIGSFFVGLLIPLSAILAWDRLRGGAPFWIQQTINYGGIRLVYPSEVMPRLAGWASFLPHLLGWPMSATVAIGLPLMLIHDLTRGARTRAAIFDLMLVTFAIGYFLLHWLLAFPVWDRYLLGLVPVVCLLIGRLADLAASALQRTARRQRLRSELVVLTVIVALLALPAAQAWQSATPVGGDHGPHDGIDRVAAFLRDLPSGAVVYDHWLGWALRYYLWDADVYIAYLATPQALADDLHVFGRSSPRYIVFPANESTTRVERAIASEGFGMSPVLSTRDRHGQPTFTLYRIDSDGNH
jgi:4-amino-4-deoxy-L-arabinose transferase-like glycosyltransferase